MHAPNACFCDVSFLLYAVKPVTNHPRWLCGSQVNWTFFAAFRIEKSKTAKILGFASQLFRMMNCCNLDVVWSLLTGKCYMRQPIQSLFARHGQQNETRKPSCRWQTRATRKHAKNCSNSTCLQRYRWQYWSIFIRLAVIASEICEIPRNSQKIQTYRVQGHPRSSILVPIESNVLSY